MIGGPRKSNSDVISRLSEATIASGSSASSNNPRKCLSVSRSSLGKQGSKTLRFAFEVVTIGSSP